MGLLGLLIDTFTAHWFHSRLTPSLAGALHALSWAGSGLWIGIVLAVAVSALAWRRHWHRVAHVILTVPGGMLLGETIKLLVRRHRPYVTGPFVDWAGYSFPSGHTIGATLLYGTTVIALLGTIRARHWRILTVLAAEVLVLLVALSRVALGAHYVTDVLAAMVIGSVWVVAWSLTFRSMRPSRVRQPSQVLR